MGLGKDGVCPNRCQWLFRSGATLRRREATERVSGRSANTKGCAIVLRDSDERCWNFWNHDVAGSGFGAARVLAMESVCIYPADIRCIVSSDVPSDGMGHSAERPEKNQSITAPRRRVPVSSLSGGSHQLEGSRRLKSPRATGRGVYRALLAASGGRS